MRIDKVVVNSSPLIVLFRSGQAELLPQMFKTIIVPHQVYKEIVIDGPLDEARKCCLMYPGFPELKWK